MGLIKAAASAIGGTFGEQWQDLIKCDEMGNEVLMKKVTTSTEQISKGSRIIVGPGQAAVIYDSGAIVDATAEEGVYTFDQSTSPSFFGGQFGAVFKEMWQRFTYNGTPAKEQAVFYFNIKEILDNKFGTGAPVPFQDWSHPIPNQMTGTYSPMRVEVKCYGKYTFKINDPAQFMRIHAGVEDVVEKDGLVEQMRSEVIGAFQNVLNELGNSVYKVPVLELPSKTDEIKQVMDKNVFDQPIRNRGVQLVSFIVESVTLDEKSNQKIDEYELSSNPYMQQGALVGAMANSLPDAANNPGGVAQGFMGIGMMNMASNGMIGGAVQAPFTQQPGQVPTQPIDPFAPATPIVTPVEQASTPAVEVPVAETSQPQVEEMPTVNVEPVATEPEVPTQKFCGNCGHPGTGNFCTRCGTKLV